MSKMNIRKNIKITPFAEQNDSITNGSIVLQFGCNDSVKYINNTSRDKVKIFLQLKDDKYKEFSEDLLQKLAVTIQLVTGFVLGPLTVVELYNDPFLNDLADIIINDTNDKLAIFDKKCNAAELQMNSSSRNKEEFIRSIRLWDYDYYMNNHATRYCKTDFDCRLSEYCLCPNGNYNGNFCPHEKKRCMSMAEYNDQSERDLDNDDIINQKCLNSGINKYKKYWNTKIIPYEDIKSISAYCSKREFINKYPQKLSLDYYLKVDNVHPKFRGDGYKISSKEHFDGNTQNSYIHIIIVCIIIILIGYYLYKKN